MMPLRLVRGCLYFIFYIIRKLRRCVSVRVEIRILTDILHPVVSLFQIFKTAHAVLISADLCCHRIVLFFLPCICIIQADDGIPERASCSFCICYISACYKLHSIIVFFFGNLFCLFRHICLGCLIRQCGHSGRSHQHGGRQHDTKASAQSAIFPH